MLSSIICVTGIILEKGIPIVFDNKFEPFSDDGGIITADALNVFGKINEIITDEKVTLITLIVINFFHLPRIFP